MSFSRTFILTLILRSSFLFFLLSIVCMWPTLPYPCFHVLVFTSKISIAFNSKEDLLLRKLTFARDLTQMAATAYSSLVSLMNVLTRYQHPTCPVPFDQPQVQTLLDKVTSLVDFLEDYYNSQTKTSRVSIQSLERKMTRAANAAEDIVESYYVTQVLNSRECLTRPYDFIVRSDLEKATHELDEIVQESLEVGVKKHKSESDHSMTTFFSQSTDNNQSNKSVFSFVQSKEESGTMPKHQEDPLVLTLTPRTKSLMPNFDDNIATSSSSFPPRDKNVMEAFETHLNEIASTKTSMHVHSSSSSRDKNIVVGFGQQLNRLMNRIRMHSLKRETIPIVGMGGIGKTTLATNAFNSPYACRHFDIRAWVTISQHVDVKNIIVSLLHNIMVVGIDQMDDEQLRDKLYRDLLGRKYLIVLDDIWDIQAWNEIMRFFPDNRNGSRILLTTRDHSVARKVGLSSTYKMELLGDDESFNLLSQKVYGPEVFPSELEIIGKAIAKSCKGLPLAIVVIGGVLKTCSKSMEFWKELSENISFVLSKDSDGQCLGVLSLSYNHLPIHLKPCFLYMATFKEDERINVSNLINLWIAEGFLKPTNNTSSNEIALQYLNDLISRNLVLVEKRGWTQNSRTVSMHDLLRELCLAEAQKVDFLCGVDRDTPNLQHRLERERRILYKHSANRCNVDLPSMPHTRSFNVISDRGSARSTQLASFCGLLRVMNIPKHSKLQINFVELVNVRYFAALLSDVVTWLGCSFSFCRQLETLILTGCGLPLQDNLFLPSEIWEFPYIRHLEFQTDIVLPDPTGGQRNCVLYNLQTIRNVANFICTDEVFRLIPNLKELCIHYCYEELIDYDKLSHSFTNLAFLPKLEVLKVHFYKCGYKKWSLNESKRLTFSPSIVELELYDSEISWENMMIVGSLPNLELLRLGPNAFYGNEWKMVEGEFQRLKYLSIVCCHLNTWNAESCHFPSLEHLKLVRLKLKEIPLGIGEIESLESIELDAQEISIFISAKEIWEERRNNQGGVDDLLVKGFYYGEWSEQTSEVAKWAEAHQNFQLTFQWWRLLWPKS